MVNGGVETYNTELVCSRLLRREAEVDSRQGKDRVALRGVPYYIGEEVRNGLGLRQRSI